MRTTYKRGREDEYLLPGPAPLKGIPDDTVKSLLYVLRSAPGSRFQWKSGDTLRKILIKSIIFKKYTLKPA